jgi:sulfur relay protein TusB/DsrH
LKYLIWLANNCVNIKEIAKGLQGKDIEVELLLLQDGVYLADRGCRESGGLKELGIKVYALRHHVEERGIAGRLVLDVDLIDYSDVVDLLMEKCDKIVSL